MAVALATGCSGRHETPAERAAAARALFEKATKEFHLPSAAAHGAEQRRLQAQAAAAYETLIRQYADQPDWAAPAWRSLGNIRAAQGNLDEAIRCYRAVQERYPQQEWEDLMAAKSAADLLWDAGRYAEARKFYQGIVSRFDQTNAAPVVRTVVRGSKARLADATAGAAK